MAMRPINSAWTLGGLALLAAGCSSDGPVPPVTSCDTTTPAVALTPLTGTTVRAADFGRCFQLQEAGDYVLVPQFASEGPENPNGEPRTLQPFGFQFGVGLTPDATAASAAVARLPWSAPAPASARGSDVASRFHAMLRQRESELPITTAVARSGGAGASLMQAQVSGGTPAATRNFRVLANLSGTEFQTVTADLKYAGNKIWLYVDQTTPAAGFTDAEWSAFGRLFNDNLYTIAANAFGTESNVDGDGHISVLFTPVVNALVQPDPDNPVNSCRSYVAGFFTGFDLMGGSDPNSNRAEIFYSSVPDPDGNAGCPIRLEQVRAITPATFIHELQHMISFNQHRIVRGGSRSENVWLNEGLSLIAEELGGKYYEAKYPPPSGRTVANQLFPDSARGFLEPNLNYAFDWLTMTSDSSVTTFNDFGSLEERGGAWLFLRWLGDQKGEQVYGKLVQTSLRGAANVAAQAGESFPTLFGDFAMAVYTDSIPGVARTSIPPRYRFTSRNFYWIFGRVSTTGTHPVSPIELAVGQSDSNDMPQGGIEFYRVRPAQAPLSFRFSRTDRTQLATSLGAQVTIFRLPDAP